MKDGTLTAQKLAERYFIGRTQLEKVLDGVADWFFNRHILFERRRGRGISIRYSEFNYRMAMLKFCSEFTPELEGLANVSAPQHLGIAERDYKAICAALGGFAPDKVAESIIKTEEEFGLSFNYTSGINQITDKPTIFRWVFVIHIKFLIFVDKKCKSLLQRIFAIFFMFCTAAVSKHCSETLSFPRIRQ